MSEIVDLLNRAAELEKRAYIDYVRGVASSGITRLVQSGVEFTKAAELIQTACEQDSTIVQMIDNANIFTKTAEYVKWLENRPTPEEPTVVVEPKPQGSLSKLASLGFDEIDLESLNHLPSSVLEKVASVASNPWEIGGGTGAENSIDGVDSFTEWLKS